MRHAHAMIRQHLLGQRLVLAQHQAVRTSARIFHPHQLQQRGDVGLVRAIAVEGLGEIEHHLRRETLQLFHNARHVVEHRQHLHFVPQALQASQYIGFGGLAFFFLQLLGREAFGRGAVSHVE